MAVGTQEYLLGLPSLIPQLPGCPTLAPSKVPWSGNPALPLLPEVNKGD